MFSFGHLDFSSGAGVRSLLEATCSATPQASCAKLDHRQVDHMHELHHAVQHQISGKWLLVGCILYNALLGDSLLRRDLDNCKGPMGNGHILQTSWAQHDEELQAQELQLKEHHQSELVSKLMQAEEDERKTLHEQALLAETASVRLLRDPMAFDAEVKEETRSQEEEMKMSRLQMAAIREELLSAHDHVRSWRQERDGEAEAASVAHEAYLAESRASLRQHESLRAEARTRLSEVASLEDFQRSLDAETKVLQNELGKVAYSIGQRDHELKIKDSELQEVRSSLVGIQDEMDEVNTQLKVQCQRVQRVERETHCQEPLPKITPKLMQWPGAVRTVVYTQVGASMRETVRGLARQVELLPTADSRTSCLAIYRCRSLAYSSLFMLERGCDLLLRVQAARSCAGLRSLASILPPQLSPFKISVDAWAKLFLPSTLGLFGPEEVAVLPLARQRQNEGRRRMLLESDGTVQSIFHVPQVEEVLYLRGTECPSIGRHVRDCEVSMPEPFAQLTEVEEAEAKLLPHDHPVLPPQIVVGSSTSAWAQPTVPVSFTGTAVSTMLLLHEICAITGLAMFSASMSGDQILLLQALHAVEAAWGNKAQRAAAEHVTWDALEHVRADFLLLEAQVKALREERHQVRPVLQLLRQQHRFLKLGALVLCREAWHAAAAELQRWALHLEGFPLEGGCRLALAVSAMPEMIGMPRKEFPALTDVMAGQEETEPEAITEFEAGCPFGTGSSREEQELLTRELRRREEENRRKERDVDPEEEVEEEPKAEELLAHPCAPELAELIEGSQSVEQLKAKQAQMALELAIKVAGETATAAERAADFEGDWLIMAKGGPGAQVEQEAGRVSVKNSLIDCHDAIVRTVGIIVKCGLRFAAAGIERLKKHMDSCLNSEGGVVGALVKVSGDGIYMRFTLNDAQQWPAAAQMKG
eukprot:g28280.t1